MEVRNWGKYQHKRNRRDPWIKLYPAILDPVDNPDFTALSMSARYLGFAILCVAAKTDNLIPSSPSWLAVEAGMSTGATSRALSELRGIGFVRPCGNGNGTEPGTEVGTEEGTAEGTSKKEQIEPSGTNVPSGSRPRDLVWDTLEEIFGKAPPGTNAHGRRNKAVADLKKFGATPDSIRSAHRRWFKVFEGATPTDAALATHFGRLLVGTIHASPQEPPAPPSHLAQDDILGAM